MQHDVFISHASEDKDSFVRELAEALRANHLDVWYDEFSLQIGDSLREAIDRGLAQSHYAIVVLSPHFFAKRWPQRELNGLVAREMDGDDNIILPIWHNIDRAQIIEHSPPLADVLGVTSAMGMDALVQQLVLRIRPEQSPLVVARNLLLEHGQSPPVVTDEWWLDMVELKEASFLFPDLNHDWRWIFPLPFGASATGKERGLDIGWTALQVGWANAAEKRQLSVITPPNEIHDFINEMPGLRECARRNPEILALYAPQITIPGFDHGFEDVFDMVLEDNRRDSYMMPGYDGPPETVGNSGPLCGDLIAWRHPTFGNYKPKELAYSFVTAHTSSYSRQVHTGFECFLWLMSDASSWVPSTLRDTLLRGFRDRTHWWLVDIARDDFGKAFVNYVMELGEGYRPPSANELTAFGEKCSSVINKLGIKEDVKHLTGRIMGFEIFRAYADQQVEFRNARRR